MRTWALALLLAAPAAAEEGLQAANQLYRQGDYARAREAYQRLSASVPGPAVHFNLANAYFKEAAPHALGHAIAGYLRAFEAAPRDGDIRHNLDFALRRAGETLVPAGTPRALHALFHCLSREELLGLQWLGWWAGLLLGSLLLLRPGLRPRLQGLLMAAVVFWAATGSWWGLRRLSAVKDPGVVLEPNAEASSGPGMHFPVSFNTPEGRRVSILSASGEWLEIGVLKEGLKGWVLARHIERI